MTIVVSLGLANSNTGHNEAITEIEQGNTVNQLQAGGLRPGPCSR